MTRGLCAGELEVDDQQRLSRDDQQRLISWTEVEFEDEKHAWAAHLSNMTSATEAAAGCQVRLTQMIHERELIAVDRYSYSSTLM